MKLNRLQLRKFINSALINEKKNKDADPFSGSTRIGSLPGIKSKDGEVGGETVIGDLPTDLKNKGDSPFVGGETVVDDKNKMVNLDQLNDYLDQMKATTQQFYRMNRSEIEKIAKKLKDVERVLMDFIDEMDQA